MPTPEAPNLPTTYFLYGSTDGYGSFEAKAIRYETDAFGRAFPCAQQNARDMAAAHQNDQRLVRNTQTKVIKALARVPRVDPEVTQEERIDHFLRALGLPVVPLVAIAQLSDLPRRGKASDIAEFFEEDPNVAGGYFSDYGLAIAAAERNLPIEVLAVHEKAHGAGIVTTVHLRHDSGINEGPYISRTGFGTSKPPTAFWEIDRHPKGFFLEEGYAELLTGAYADLFLPSSPVYRVPGYGPTPIFIPDKYFQKENADGSVRTASGTAAVLGLELLAEHDPQILDSLIEARLSLGGLRSLAANINTIQPGLYSKLLHTPNNHWGFRSTMQHIVESLYGGDYDAIAGLGGCTKAFVVKKLLQYQARTGYEFGLRPDIGKTDPDTPLRDTVTTVASETTGTKEEAAGITAQLKRLWRGFGNPT
jgi:hypothetical protein